MAVATYKCTSCKKDKKLSVEEQNKKFSIEEMGVIKKLKYCKKHYEIEMDKRVKCDNCSKSIKRRNGIGADVEYTQKGTTVMRNKFFCSKECESTFKEEVKYGELFIQTFMQYHNITDTTEIPKLVFIQLTSFKKKYELSNKGTYYTLNFMIDSRKEIPKDNVWFLVNEYDNARAYYTELNRRKRESQEQRKNVNKKKYFKLPTKIRDDERVKRLLYLPDEEE